MSVQLSLNRLAVAPACSRPLALCVGFGVGRFSLIMRSCVDMLGADAAAVLFRRKFGSRGRLGHAGSSNSVGYGVGGLSRTDP